MDCFWVRHLVLGFTVPEHFTAAPCRVGTVVTPLRLLLLMSGEGVCWVDTSGDPRVVQMEIGGELVGPRSSIRRRHLSTVRTLFGEGRYYGQAVFQEHVTLFEGFFGSCDPFQGQVTHQRLFEVDVSVNVREGNCTANFHVQLEYFNLSKASAL